MKVAKPWRVLIKASILFVIFDLLYITVNPLIYLLSVYNWLVPGRARFPYAPSQQQEEIVHSISDYEDMNAMYSVHIISSMVEKPPDEFRVIFLGDSSFWGPGMPPESTLPGQINELNLVTCTQKHVKAYNLSFPSLYVMKDLLILQRAMAYQPDLIIWGVTLRSLEKNEVNASSLLQPHSEEALTLIDSYGIDIATEDLRSRTLWDQTLWARRTDIKKYVLLQGYALPWIATGFDSDSFGPGFKGNENDIFPNNIYMEHGTHITSDGLMLDVLGAGSKIAGRIPILFVNEPIYIAGGENSDRYYNIFYTREKFDQYRRILSDWATENSQPFFDAWNILPQPVFGDTPLHLLPAGESQFASDLGPVVIKLSCR